MFFYLIIIFFQNCVVAWCCLLKVANKKKHLYISMNEINKSELLLVFLHKKLSRGFSFRSLNKFVYWNNERHDKWRQSCGIAWRDGDLTMTQSILTSSIALFERFLSKQQTFSDFESSNLSHCIVSSLYVVWCVSDIYNQINDGKVALKVEDCYLYLCLVAVLNIYKLSYKDLSWWESFVSMAIIE